MKQVSMFLLFSTTVFMWSCINDSPENNQTETTREAVVTEDMAKLSVEEGMAMLKMHCYACHNPLAPSHDALLAPPMVAAKFRYQKQYPDRDAFIEHMSDFLYEPTEEKAKMKNAVERFGVMAKTLLSKEEIIRISAYIYDNKLEEPSWFAEHFEEEHGQKWVQQ